MQKPDQHRAPDDNQNRSDGDENSGQAFVPELDV